MTSPTSSHQARQIAEQIQKEQTAADAKSKSESKGTNT